MNQHYLNTMKVVSLSLKGLLVATFFTAPVFAQEPGEIGIHISSWGTEQLTLDYRKPLLNGFTFVTGLSMGIYEERSNLGVSEWTETVHLTRQRTEANKDINLKIGFTRNIKQGPFYWGVNLLGGYNHQDVYGYNSGSFYDEEKGGWVVMGIGRKPTQEITYNDFSSETTWNKLHSGRAGAQANFGVNVKFKERLTLNVFSSAYGGILGTFINTVIVNPDPEILGPNPANLPLLRLDHSVSFGAGLRYSLR